MKFVVEQRLDFEFSRLDAYLLKVFGSTGGEGEPLEISRTQGGMSNPTYFLRRGSWQAVLRKQPAGVVLPSAHAIDREFRVLKALKESEVPVPQPMHYCSEREILGTPFYLMERIEGRVFQDFALPGLNSHERRDIYKCMASTLAGIHRLDFHAVGLSDYGRPGNYFERQLKRWSQQWASFRRDDEDNPALDQLVIWLSSHVPASELLVLCHGDFRIGNLIFHSSESRIVGVLDWELSTLGHPLVDVAFNSQAWSMAPDENGGLLGLSLAEMGIPSEAEYLELYYELANSPERMTTFHKAFAMFRGAVGSAGVAARGEAGNGFLPNAARIGRKLALAYAQRGMELIQSGH